jgi:hypothetical protein
MIKIKIAIAVIVISIVSIIVNSGGLAIPNAQAASDEDNNAQSSDDDVQTSDENNKAESSDDNNNLQTFNDDVKPSDEDKNTQSSNDNNKGQTSDDGNNVMYFEHGGTVFAIDKGNSQTSDERNNAQSIDDGNNVIFTNQELLPDLSSSNQKIVRFDETPLVTLNQSTKDIQNQDTQTELNKSPAASSQKDVQQLKQSEKPTEIPKYKTVNGKLCKLDNIDKNGNTFYSCTNPPPADDKAKHIGQLWECNPSDTGCIHDIESFKRAFEQAFK